MARDMARNFAGPGPDGKGRWRHGKGRWRHGKGRVRHRTGIWRSSAFARKRARLGPCTGPTNRASHSLQRITSPDAAGARRLQRISGYATERIGAITPKQRGGKPRKQSTEVPTTTCTSTSGRRTCWRPSGPSEDAQRRSNDGLSLPIQGGSNVRAACEMQRCHEPCVATGRSSSDPGAVWLRRVWNHADDRRPRSRRLRRLWSRPDGAGEWRLPASPGLEPTFRGLRRPRAVLTCVQARAPQVWRWNSMRSSEGASPTSPVRTACACPR
jgi:hypothetical protein